MANAGRGYRRDRRRRMPRKKKASLGDVSDRHVAVVAENSFRGRRRDRTRPPANTADSRSDPPALAARGDGVLEGAPYPSKTLEVTKGRSPLKRTPALPSQRV